MSSLSLIFAAAALAAPYTDAAEGLSVDFPSGWGAPQVIDDTGTVEAKTPTGELFCRANSNALASLKTKTQGELNRENGAPFDKATWAGVFEVDPAKIEISEGSVRLVDGQVEQFVTITFATEVMGSPMMARMASFILPGRMVNVGCFAPIGAFGSAREAFDQVATSLRPR